MLYLFSHIYYYTILCFDFHTWIHSGRRPIHLVPLYVRNTLQERNGITVTGDQLQSKLAVDRRYSHAVGRVLTIFESSDVNT